MLFRLVIDNSFSNEADLGGNILSGGYHIDVDTKALASARVRIGRAAGNMMSYVTEWVAAKEPTNGPSVRPGEYRRA